ISSSAEPAGMLTRCVTCGPSRMPAMRKTATSGILIFCATKAASVPTARISPHESSVCWAIADEEASMDSSIEALQPGRDLAHRDIGLVEQLAHREEAVELASEMSVGDAYAILFQPRGIFVAFVAERIAGGGEHIGRRKSRQRFDARGRGAPVVVIGIAHV